MQPLNLGISASPLSPNMASPRQLLSLIPLMWPGTGEMNSEVHIVFSSPILFDTIGAPSHRCDFLTSLKLSQHAAAHIMLLGGRSRVGPRMPDANPGVALAPVLCATRACDSCCHWGCLAVRSSMVSSRAGPRMPDADPGVASPPSSAPHVLAILAVIGGASPSQHAHLCLTHCATWKKEQHS